MANKNKFKQVLTVYYDFLRLTLEETQEKMKDVIQKHGVRAVHEETGISVDALYRYCKALYVRKGSKPDFIHYCKVMEFGDKKGRKSDEQK